MGAGDFEERPTVLLLHELAGGSSHVDWLIAQDSRGSRPLVSFRAGARIDALEPGGSIEAERLADHRPVYLEYEGPISGGRGSVRRLERGRVTALEERPAEWRLEVHWETRGPQRLRLRTARGAERWVIEAL